jgi:hypothetical protein
LLSCFPSVLGALTGDDDQFGDSGVALSVVVYQLFLILGFLGVNGRLCLRTTQVLEVHNVRLVPPSPQ